MEVSFFTSFYFAESVGGIHGENGVSQNELGEDVLVKDCVYWRKKHRNRIMSGWVRKGPVNNLLSGGDSTTTLNPILTWIAKWLFLRQKKTYFQIIVKNYNGSQCQLWHSAISAIILPKESLGWKLISLRSTVVKNLTNAICVISQLPKQEDWETIWESTRGRSRKGAQCAALFALPNII